MKKYLLVFLFFYACSHTIDNIIVVRTPIKNLGEEEYLKLDKIYEKKHYDKYLSSSNVFIQEFYESEYTARVLFNRAEIYMSKGAYVDAYNELNIVHFGFPNSDLKNQAILNKAICKYKLDDKYSSIDLLNLINTDALDTANTEKTYWILANLHKETNNHLDSSYYFIKLYEFTKSEDIKQSAFISLVSNFSKLNLNELKNLSTYSNSNFIQAYVLFEYGNALYQEGNSKEARKIILTYINKYPNHEYITFAKDLIKKIDSLELVNPYTIGVILPLSGRDKAFGQRSLNGIQLAANFYNTEEDNKDLPIKLAIVDTRSDPDIARISVDKLISEDNVIGIIGSLRSDTAEIVSGTASIMSVPNISLSRNDNIADISPYVFSISMTKENQINKLVSYAIEVLNIKKFGILYPNDSYGREYMNLFWNNVLLKGGEITAVELYEAKQVDFKDEFQKLAGLFYRGLRLKEFELLKELKTVELGRTPRPNELKLPPIIDFEALFIPDDARSVGQIAPYLAFYDIDNVVILGTNLLNSNQLISRGKQHVEGLYFVDDFFIDNNNTSSISFIQKFRNIFNRDPGSIEADSYDAAKLMINAMSELDLNQLSRSKLRHKIANTRAYLGATGTIDILENGSSEKSLFLLSVEKQKIIQKK